jgi:DNA-binding NarL/FixJ family response regulator
LEAAGLSVVVVVALEASPATAAMGHAVRRVRRSLETTGLSVVADAAGAVAPARTGSRQANLVLLRDEPRSPSRDEARTLDLNGGAPYVGAPADPVIVLTTASDEAAARAAFVAGGLGYIVTSGEREPAAGPTTSDEWDSGALSGGAVGSPSGPGNTASGRGLTGREVEVLQALATGASTAEVARELFVSPKTAKNHIAHIYAKLGVSSRTQAVAKALRQGIVNID